MESKRREEGGGLFLSMLSIHIDMPRQVIDAIKGTRANFEMGNSPIVHSEVNLRCTLIIKVYIPILFYLGSSDISQYSILPICQVCSGEKIILYTCSQVPRYHDQFSLSVFLCPSYRPFSFVALPSHFVSHDTSSSHNYSRSNLPLSPQLNSVSCPS